MATNLEQWDPNIKSPGVQQNPGGAYRNPEAVIPNWAAITASWQQMQKDIVSGVEEYNKTVTTLAEETARKEKERQMNNAKGAEEFDHQGVAGVNEQNIAMVTDWYEGKLAEWQLKYGEDAGFGNLTMKEQMEVRNESKQLGMARESLKILAEEWHKNNDIDYSKLIDSPKTREFLNQMFKTPGSMKKIETRNGVMGIVYKDEKGEEQFMNLGTLTANVNVWKDASEEKDKQWDRIEKIVAPHRKKISDIQKLVKKGVANGGITEADGKAEILKLTQDLQGQLIGKKNPDTGKWDTGQGIFAGDGYGHATRKFIHHNFLGEDKKFIKTDFDNEEFAGYPLDITGPLTRGVEMNITVPTSIDEFNKLKDKITIGEANIDDFNKDFMEFVNTAFNVVEDPTLFAPDIPSITEETGETELTSADGKTFTVDNMVLNRVKTLYNDILKPLSKHPKEGYEEVGAKSSEADAKYIVTNKNDKTLALWSALEVGRDKRTLFGWGKDTVQEHLDIILDKNAAKQTLTAAEKGVLEEYKKFKGGFDEDTDLTSSMPNKWANVNLNRRDQKVKFKQTFATKPDKIIYKDLTKEADRIWVMQQLIQASGHGSATLDTSVDAITKYLIGRTVEEGGTTFEKYIKPKLK